MDIFETIAQERRALADLVDTLSDEQLRTPSLMPTWTVRDVVGHLVLGLRLPMLRLLVTLLVTRSMDQTTDRLTWHLGKLPLQRGQGRAVRAASRLLDLPSRTRGLQAALALHCRPLRSI